MTSAAHFYIKTMKSSLVSVELGLNWSTVVQHHLSHVHLNLLVEDTYDGIGNTFMSLPVNLPTCSSWIFTYSFFVP